MRHFDEWAEFWATGSTTKPENYRLLNNFTHTERDLEFSRIQLDRREDNKTEHKFNKNWESNRKINNWRFFVFRPFTPSPTWIFAFRVFHQNFTLETSVQYCEKLQHKCVYHMWYMAFNTRLNGQFIMVIIPPGLMESQWTHMPPQLFFWHSPVCPLLLDFSSFSLMKVYRRDFRLLFVIFILFDKHFDVGPNESINPSWCGKNDDIDVKENLLIVWGKKLI